VRRLAAVLLGARELDQLGVLEHIGEVAGAEVEGVAGGHLELTAVGEAVAEPAGIRWRAQTISPISVTCVSIASRLR
jgi:hypothetical protein